MLVLLFYGSDKIYFVSLHVVFVLNLLSMELKSALIFLCDINKGERSSIEHLNYFVQKGISRLSIIGPSNLFSCGRATFLRHWTLHGPRKTYFNKI